MVNLSTGQRSRLSHLSLRTASGTELIFHKYLMNGRMDEWYLAGLEEVEGHLFIHPGGHGWWSHTAPWRVTNSRSRNPTYEKSCQDTHSHLKRRGGEKGGRGDIKHCSLSILWLCPWLNTSRPRERMWNAEFTSGEARLTRRTRPCILLPLSP